VKKIIYSCWLGTIKRKLANSDGKVERHAAIRDLRVETGITEGLSLLNRNRDILAKTLEEN